MERSSETLTKISSLEFSVVVEICHFSVSILRQPSIPLTERLDGNERNFVNRFPELRGAKVFVIEVMVAMTKTSPGTRASMQVPSFVTRS